MRDLPLPELARRARQEGLGGVARRVVRRLYDRLDASSLDFPLLPADVADSTRLRSSTPATPPARGRPLTVAWLSTPPGAGSGGHTTLFRMVQAFEQAGHTCVLYLYDRHGGSLQRHEQVVRDCWPWVRAQVADAASLPSDLDAYVASSWPTAHVLANRAVRGRRFYFVQDYEPFFYPRGSEYALAEDSYRFGFTHIALGEMVATCLSEQVGVPSSTVPFGCDTDTYRRTNASTRHGVVLYAKPTVGRRGFRLAQLALQEFHRSRPDEPLHLYGDAVPDLGFPAVRHARMTPPQLNDLYNQVKAGLAMSFTNISLVAEEMLASGAVPVINDSPLSRADLPHPLARFAPSTPGGLADALVDIVDHDDAMRSARAAAGVRTDGWRITGRAVTSLVEAEVYEAPPAASVDIRVRTP